jgi:hypothetical protein
VSAVGLVAPPLLLAWVATLVVAAAIRVLVVACALLAPALAAVAERVTGLDRRL